MRLAGGCDGPPGLGVACAERERAPRRSRFGRIRAPTPVAAALRIPQPRLVVARAALTVLESCGRALGCENTAPVKLFGYSCAGSFLPRTTASRQVRRGLREDYCGVRSLRRRLFAPRASPKSKLSDLDKLGALTKESRSPPQTTQEASHTSLSSLRRLRDEKPETDPQPSRRRCAQRARILGCLRAASL